jgi:hypothetical protein
MYTKGPQGRGARSSRAKRRQAVAQWLDELAKDSVGAIYLCNLSWYASSLRRRHASARRFVERAMAAGSPAINGYRSAVQLGICAAASRVPKADPDRSLRVASAVSWPTIFQHYLDNSSRNEVIRLGRCTSTTPSMMKGAGSTIDRWIANRTGPGRSWYKPKAMLGYGTPKVVYAYGWVSPMEDLKAQSGSTAQRASKARDLLGLVDWATTDTDTSRMMLIVFDLKDLPHGAWVARPGLASADKNSRRFAQRLPGMTAGRAYDRVWGMTVNLAKVAPIATAASVGGLPERIVAPTPLAQFKNSPRLEVFGQVDGVRGNGPSDNDAVYERILRDGTPSATVADNLRNVVVP